MMKFRFALCFMMLLSLCMSCHNEDDTLYFNGEIRTFEVTGDVKKVALKSITLNGPSFGWLSAYDSLLIFRNPKLSDRFFSIFHADTGEEMGTFLNKGKGPEEFADLHKIYSFFKEGDELKTVLLDFYKERLFIWNINQSLSQGMPIIDRIIPYPWKEQNENAVYGDMFYLPDTTLLIEIQYPSIYKKVDTYPCYQKRTIGTNKLLKEYSFYKQPLVADGEPAISGSLFLAGNACKPDGTKIVEAMYYLPQLNILDVETGQVSGHRIEGGADFSSLKDEDAIEHVYYSGVQADDNYIYARYWGKKVWNKYDTPYFNTIHVFDWEGNFIQAIETDRSLGEMWMDSTRHRLYITTPGVDEIFYLDLNGLVS